MIKDLTHENMQTSKISTIYGKPAFFFQIKETENKKENLYKNFSTTCDECFINNPV